MAARHAHTRPTTRPAAARVTAPAQCRGRSRRGAGPDAASRNRGTVPAPTLLGVVACTEDFEALRQAGRTEYAAFADYLRDMRELLGRLSQEGGIVRGRAFHSEGLDEYCRDNGLSPNDPYSHTEYTADPAAEVEWVLYQGEPLPEFLARLTRARERGLVHRRLERMLAETAEAALNGVFPEEPLREAYRLGSRALRRILVGAGPGRFRLVCAMQSPEGPVEAWTDLLLEAAPGGGDGGGAQSGASSVGSVLRIEEAELDLLCSLLCVGSALGLPGGVLLSGTCERRGSVAWGWGFDGADFAPRNAADVLLDLSGPAASWISVCLPGALAVPGFPLGGIALDTLD